MGSALINEAVVTIYGRPSYDDVKLDKNSSIQDEGLYGMPVEIIERCDNQFVKIRTHYRYEGYVSLKDLYMQTEEALKKREASNLKVVLHPYIDVLVVDRVQSIILKQLTRGAILQVVEENNKGWTKVCLNDKQEGYVKSTFLGTYYKETSSHNEKLLRKKLVQSALAYLGTQYRWGGKSTLGIDCSGLTSMAYLLNGIVIYRDAKIMPGFPIHEIAFGNKKEGDLLYFPGHIAMYIGEERYIHSTAQAGSDGVVISSLNPRDKDYRQDLAKSLISVGSIF